ncbi:hypothetical protein Tcan_15049 [Toxocara canis]|uniref:Uncharacterized protein n=1 Tax=Toxocara canis TaxID=6265 RepID=A0A0B2VST3_TOXCA|nr:hypothetical protein Tcan_15049 [Toxocara canis]
MIGAKNKAAVEELVRAKVNKMSEMITQMIRARVYANDRHIDLGARQADDRVRTIDESEYCPLDLNLDHLQRMVKAAIDRVEARLNKENEREM